MYSQPGWLRWKWAHHEKISSSCGCKLMWRGAERSSADDAAPRSAAANSWKHKNHQRVRQQFSKCAASSAATNQMRNYFSPNLESAFSFFILVPEEFKSESLFCDLFTRFYLKLLFLNAILFFVFSAQVWGVNLLWPIQSDMSSSGWEHRPGCHRPPRGRSPLCLGQTNPSRRPGV